MQANKSRLSAKQLLYLERAGDPEVDRIDGEGWMLVEQKPEIEEAAVDASFVLTFGETVMHAGSFVWVDPTGREHFGPGEAGYDRFNLNDEGF